MSERPNVFVDDWEQLFPPLEGWRSNTRRLAPDQTLGLRVIELEPGQTQCPYHFHHGNEEFLLVLSGSPTLRGPDGERELDAGDFVHFPTGPDGAHQVFNKSDKPARYLFADAKVSPEVIEYPDSGKLASMSRATRLQSVNRLDDAVDYFAGEAPHA